MCCRDHSISGRDFDAAEKLRLKRDASYTGVSMKKVVCRLIDEKRTRAERQSKPSAAFAMQVRENHGGKLSPAGFRGDQPPSCSGEEIA